MKLRRKAKPDFDPEFAPLMAELFVAYEEGMERCREVASSEEIDDDLRARALASAIRIAHVGRVTFEALMYLDLADRVPEKFTPTHAIAASARLAYSLTATADPDGQPETILSISELDELPVQYELQAWLDTAPPRPAGDQA
jgi:hypothetical protein